MMAQVVSTIDGIMRQSRATIIAAIEAETGKQISDVSVSKLLQFKNPFTSLEGHAAYSQIVRSAKRKERAENDKVIASARLDRWIAAGRPIGDVITTPDGNWSLKPDGGE